MKDLEDKRESLRRATESQLNMWQEEWNMYARILEAAESRDFLVVTDYIKSIDKVEFFHRHDLWDEHLQWIRMKMEWLGRRMDEIKTSSVV